MKNFSITSIPAYQLKISFADEKPPVWKRVVVPYGITYSQLYYVITILFDLKKLDYYETFEFEYFKIGLSIREHHSNFRGSYYEKADSSLTFIDDEFDYYKSCRLFVGDYYADYNVETGQIDEANKYRSGVNFLITIEKILEDHSENYPVLLKSKGADPLSSHRSALTDDEVQEELKHACSVEYLEEHPFPSFSEILESNGEFYGMTEPESEELDWDDDEFMDSAMEDMYANDLIGELLVLSNDDDDEEDDEFDKLTNDIKESYLDNLDWSRFVPDAFSDYMMGYSKSDLLEISKDYRIKNDSNADNRTIAKILSMALLTEDMLKYRFKHLGYGSLYLLKRVVENDGIAKFTVDEWEDAEALDRTFFGNMVSIGKRFIAPSDTVEPIRSILSDEIIDKAVKSFWLERCLFYLEWIYVYAPLDVFTEIVNCKDDIEMTKEEIVKLVHDPYVKTHEEFVIRDNEIICDKVFPDESFLPTLRKGQEGKDYYIPTVEDIDIFYRKLYPADEDAYKRMRAFLMNFTGRKDKTEVLLINSFRTISYRNSMQKVLDLFKPLELSFESEQQLEEFTRLYNDLSHSTRIPWNRGNKPTVSGD